MSSRIKSGVFGLACLMATLISVSLLFFLLGSIVTEGWTRLSWQLITQMPSETPVVYHVFEGTEDRWLESRKELFAFLAEHNITSEEYEASAKVSRGLDHEPSGIRVMEVVNSGIKLALVGSLWLIGCALYLGFFGAA